MTDYDMQPHRRYNPLNDSWVLVSPQRLARPWQGAGEAAVAPEQPYDPDCYLCPGNVRASGEVNPQYDGTFVFDNDFPALLPGSGRHADTDDLLRRALPVHGRCKVVCYGPRHDQALADFDHEQIGGVLQTWMSESRDLHADHEWVQIFENRGQAMGCSNPHPHGQIWASDTPPTEAQRELDAQIAYRDAHGHSLLAEYAARELDAGERVLVSNDRWLAVVPWWAVWPFETLIVARQPRQRLHELDDEDSQQLADLLLTLMQSFDRLFDTPFPYSMGWHGAPGSEDCPAWRLHGHVFPPLLRGAGVRKFMVGYELLGEPQRDLTPEAAAAALRLATSGRGAE